MNGIENTVKDWRVVSARIEDFKRTNFPHGTPVYCTAPSFKGHGISMGKSDGARPDQLPVLLENGNTWHYPIEEIHRLKLRSECPRWIWRFKRWRVDGKIE